MWHSHRSCLYTFKQFDQATWQADGNIQTIEIKSPALSDGDHFISVYNNEQYAAGNLAVKVKVEVIEASSGVVASCSRASTCSGNGSCDTQGQC